MSQSQAVCLVLALVAVPTPAGAQEVLPIPVFVTSIQVPSPPPLKPEAHAAAIEGAKSAMYDLAAKLRKEHGDNTKAWPPQVWDRFNVAEDAYQLAIARQAYQAPETRQLLDNSVADLARDARGKAMTVVGSAQEAALVVQIVGRRQIQAPGVTDNTHFIRFRLLPGGKMRGARFLELTRDYKWNNLWLKVLAHPQDENGYYEMEAGTFASWKNAAGMVRSTVELFIKTRIDPARKK
jgi:hypothetical protein